MTTFHMRYKGEEDIKRDGANDKQAGSSGGEQSLQRRGNAGEKAVQELSRLSRLGRLYIPDRKQPENSLKQTIEGDGGEVANEAMRDNTPSVVVSTLAPQTAAACQYFTGLSPLSLPPSGLSLSPGQFPKCQPLPLVHPTRPLESPPPAKGVGFWKYTSADYTVYRKPTLQ